MKSQAAVIFNVSNKLMFGIGVFPYAMISSLCLFLPPNAPASLCAFLINGGSDSSRKSARILEPEKRRRSPLSAAQAGGPTRAGWIGLGISAGFVVLQLALPLRHAFLYSGNPSWHEEGHLHAWHMKLRSKQGTVLLKLIVGPPAPPAAPMTPAIAALVGGRWLDTVPPIWRPAGEAAEGDHSNRSAVPTVSDLPLSSTDRR